MPLRNVLRSVANPFRHLLCVRPVVFGVLLCSLTSGVISADPGTGLLVLRDSSVVFGDPARNLVWRIDARGRVSVLVRGKHVHRLRLDRDGAIVSEHLEYIASGDKWRSSFWRLGPRDTVPQTIEGPRTSAGPFPDGMSLLLDGEGRGYSWRWTDGSRTAQQLVRRSPNTELETFTASGWRPLGTSTAAFQFGQVASMAFIHNGDVIVAELKRVLQVTERGSVRVLARLPELPPNTAAPAADVYLKRLWGVAVDQDGAVYVADGGKRQVVRLAEGRPPESVVTLADRFFPVGVTLAGARLYVLEYPDPGYTAATGPRVRIVPLDGHAPQKVLGATPPEP